MCFEFLILESIFHLIFNTHHLMYTHVGVSVLKGQGFPQPTRKNEKMKFRCNIKFTGAIGKFDSSSGGGGGGGGNGGGVDDMMRDLASNTTTSPPQLSNNCSHILLQRINNNKLTSSLFSAHVTDDYTSDMFDLSTLDNLSIQRDYSALVSEVIYFHYYYYYYY